MAGRWSKSGATSAKLLSTSFAKSLVTADQLVVEGVCHADQLDERPGSHFLENASSVEFYRRLSDSNLGSDLLIASARDNMGHNIPFPWRQGCIVQTELGNARIIEAAPPIMLDRELDRVQKLLVTDRLG
jgi:hypothetical protein